jgi:hypothetical protein
VTDEPYDGSADEPAPYQPRGEDQSPQLICLRCGSLTVYNAMDLHDDFHARLDKRLP